MKIRCITLSNLHSIRQEIKVDFTTSPLADTGLFAITGDTGAGKTTILDAITLAMYGEICRQAKPEESLSYGTEAGFARCEFEAKGRRFLASWSVRTTRSKNPNKRLKTERSVAEWEEKTASFRSVAGPKVGEIKAFIEDVTGLDFPRFTRSVLLAQGDFAAFLKASERERSDLLERITGTEIYSELSKGALLRKNEEEAKLSTLTHQRDALRLLTSEEVLEKKAALKSQKTEDQAKRQQLSELKANLAKQQLVERLQSRKTAAESNLSVLGTERKNLQADLEKLEAHHKTLPLHADLARLEDKSLEVEKLHEEVVAVNADLAKWTELAAAAQPKMEAAKTQCDELRAGQQKAFRLFDKVAALDEKLTSRRDAFAKQKAQLDELAAQLKSLEEKQLAQQKAIAEHQQAIAKLNSWLVENAAAAGLTKDLPTIKVHRENLRDIQAEQQDATAAVQAIDKSLKAAEQALAKIEKNWQSARAALEQLTTEFQEKTPTALPATRHDLLEKLNREIENAVVRQGYFQQLRSLNEAYAQTLEEIQALETELDNLRREELALDKALLSAVEVADEAAAHLKFKQGVHQQQLLVANFEQARAELQAGEPCPVCLSTEHPFRGQEVTPFVEESKRELLAAEARVEKLNRRRNSLLNRHSEVAADILGIDSSTTGQLGKLHARLHLQERKMTELFPHFDGEGIVETYGENLLKKLADFEIVLAEKKTLRNELAKLHTQLSDQETALRELENQRRDLQFQVNNWQEKRKTCQQQFAELEGKFAEKAKALDAIVGKYGYRFSMDDANGMFAELEATEQEFSEKNTRRTQHERKLELAEQSLAQLRDAAAETAGKFAKLKAEVMLEQTSLNDLITNRLQLFGDKEPQREREHFLQKIEAAEQAFGEAKSTHDEAKNELHSLQKKNKDLHHRLQQYTTQLTELTELLTGKLASAGFASIEVLRQSVLPQAEAVLIQRQAENLRKRQIETEQDLKTLTAELEAALAQPWPELPREAMEATAQQLEGELQEIQQAIGALQQQLRDNEARGEEATRLLAEIEAQRKTFHRWLALYDLIGSSDGKKFRVFAQGLTLAKLVQLANVHLANLHGRYVITKRPGEDLELDIVDTFQADNVRSMHTLSGGESFLVSLALALGLSDLAGRNANIRSLFIDEGFGTLDDQALEMAISTLENLQASGKTIGVISHVKELKERISTQVRLVKKGGGMSEVEVLG